MRRSTWCLGAALATSLLLGQDTRSADSREASTSATRSDDGLGTNRLPRTKSEWKRVLNPMQYYVTREKGTEQPFTGEYWNSKKAGTYCCVCCGAPLFSSDTKFESGTGWPSFFQPHRKEALKQRTDTSGRQRRTEVLCRQCDAHLGHVFDDGPRPTGLRYCINSAALKLKPAEQPAGTESPTK